MFDRFERLIDPFRTEGIEGPPPDTLVRFCWYYTRPIWPVLAAVGILGALIAVFEVMVFSFLGDLVNWLSSANRETFFADNWPRLMWMAAVILVILPAINALWESLFHQGVLGNYPMNVRWRVHRYLLRQSIGFYQNDFAGRIANKVMQTALAVREVVTRIVDILVYISVYFVSALFLVGEASWELAAPLVFWLLAYLGVIYYFVPKLKDASRDQADARALMTGHVVDAYTNISTVKLFSHTEREENYAKNSMWAFLQTVFRQMRLVTVLNISLNGINTLLLFSTGALAIFLWRSSTVSTGDIAVAIALVLRLQGMSQWILWEVSGLFENVGTVQDGITTISREREVVDRAGAKPLVVQEGAIRFDKIRFHYGKASGVIEDLTLDIRPGEKIGLIGRSGAGKSTLVNLLLRFYDLEGGTILVDNQDISAVTQESLRSQVGVVTQDTSLLHRSVLENIVYGRPDAGREEAWEAARRAHAARFIEGLEDLEGRRGMDAHVGERGVKLSGGQRQRIAIARVLLKDAPILVLDEATSALDSEIEAAIQESLSELMEGKTVIAIAHRLSTIAAMDRLVVMDEGRIVEEGTHQDLLARGGLYADLWKRQSGGFIDSAAVA
ncbi:ATP-binding cassette domain-containing protein [Stappia sp. GBMRC 2046]|uniref:ATP-binding cassette domain-containing protein n=1 Tax=Stappia sediminis TaxID=2692190 RepID=A0A7X3LQP4_9HYPH|nr:ABC transporter ATP-binding protein [Stappia sediminis]MXN63335.1 ATP-binding cassette domain-containing protein [Stappia sediminis]